MSKSTAKSIAKSIIVILGVCIATWVLAHLGAVSALFVYMGLTGDQGKHLAIGGHVISMLIGGFVGFLLSFPLWWLAFKTPGKPPTPGEKSDAIQALGQHADSLTIRKLSK